MKWNHKLTKQQYEDKFAVTNKIRNKDFFEVTHIEQLYVLRKFVNTGKTLIGIYEESDLREYVKSDPTVFTYDVIDHKSLRLREPNVFVYKDVPVVEEAFPPAPIVRSDPWTIGGIMERLSINIELNWWTDFWKWYHAKSTHAPIAAGVLAILLFLDAVILKHYAYY